MRLYLEAMVVVVVAVILARIIDLLIPMPKPDEPPWKTRLMILLQLFIDVTVVFVVLVLMNRRGFLLQDSPVGIVAFMLFLTVFFLFQHQLTVRMDRLQTKKVFGRKK